MTAVAAEDGVNVTGVVPNVGGAWDRIAQAQHGSHLAHSPEWATVIERAYGHRPLYLSARDGEGQAAVLPAFIVRRPLVGTVVTSMPFLDGGGPCSASPSLSSGLVARLVEEARRLGATLVELRCAERLDVGCEPREHKVNMALSLEGGADAVWRRLDSHLRNHTRKASRLGLTVEFGGAEKLDAFYAIHVDRMRELGSPVHAREFFAGILEAFGPRARIALVTREGRPIGGLVALAYKDTVLAPWASCLSRYFTQYPNLILYWETIRRACLDGHTRFDFGRSTRGSGTHRFKKQWGATEVPLFWYSIPLGRARSVPTVSNGHGATSATAIWQRLPLGVTRTLGPRIRKYLIQ
jgi:FemAB-related protein (PEP-CTERM system-associated)